MNATTLREMLNKSGDDRAANALVDPLLDVLEAAEEYSAERDNHGPDYSMRRLRYDQLKAAIAALYRRAGEVMDGK